jgi:hypothetical protein
MDRPFSSTLRGATFGFLLTIAGCGGSGQGLDGNGRPTTSTGPDTPLTADLQSIQDHIFTPICTQCHTGAAAPLGFRLDEGDSYAMLVNTPSVEVPALLRVNPGNPDSSYIIQKLEGHAAVGGQMPLGQTPLPQATIDTIRQWISDGAASATQTAASSASTESTLVRVIAPVDGQTMSRTAGDPLFEANGELDTNSLNFASVTVMRGDESIVGDARIEIRSLQPTTFAIILPTWERTPGTYRIIIRGTGAAPVLDRSGRPINEVTVQYSIEDLQ